MVSYYQIRYGVHGKMGDDTMIIYFLYNHDQ